MSIPNQTSYLFNHIQQVVEKPHEYSSHAHDMYELIYIVKGNLVYTIEEKSYPLQSGDLIITKPCTHHCLTLKNGKYERYNILFHAERLFDIDIETVIERNEVFHCGYNTSVDNIFQRMMRYKTEFASDFENLLYLLLSELCYCLTHIDRTVIPIVNTTMSKAIVYINENLFTIKNVTQLSNVLYVSETYLFRIFNQHLKISPKKYITEKRLLAAKQRIAAGEKPTEIYLSCGFNDYTVFYRNYVKMFGMPPSRMYEST
ncbi:MAG: AraC family transcriptional regulator [Clostridia bacterium]|nr:AraC family transcriptional regulator [Clostridia bacterium]